MAVYSITPTGFPTAATSHLVAMPASVQSGSLLLMLWVNATLNTIAVPSGWTQLSNNTAAGTGADSLRSVLLARVADGSEGGTFVDVVTNAVRVAAAQVLCFPPSAWFGGAIADAVKIGTPVIGSPAANADPPNLDPGWGAGPVQVVLARFSGRNDSGTPLTSGWPSGFADVQSTKSAFTGANSSVELELAALYNAVGATNPGAFTSASAYFVANTVIVRLGNQVGAAALALAAAGIGAALSSGAGATSLELTSAAVSAAVQPVAGQAQFGLSAEASGDAPTAAAGLATVGVQAIAAGARLAAAAGLATIGFSASAVGTTREPEGVPDIEWDDDVKITNVRVFE